MLPKFVEAYPKPDLSLEPIIVESNQAVRPNKIVAKKMIGLASRREVNDWTVPVGLVRAKKSQFYGMLLFGTVDGCSITWKVWALTSLAVV